VSDIHRATVDGVPVKVGDVVWRADAHIATVTSCRLYAHHLGMWWQTTSKEIYSTERAALAAAIKLQKIARSKAQSAERRAARAIERFVVRMEALP
jgi:hypothetical protein